VQHVERPLLDDGVGDRGEELDVAEVEVRRVVEVDVAVPEVVEDEHPAGRAIGSTSTRRM
jgi:hypothetical protein